MRLAYPLSHLLQGRVKGFRQTLANIIKGRDSRFLLIVGPCSIHNIDGALEYGNRLKVLAQKHASSLFICMRAYCEKPRTSIGWKGLINDPDLTDKGRVDQGLIQTRKLFLDLTEMGVPIATEFLDPLVADYVEDCVSWGAIGARTCTSQIHRQLASRLDMPVGFKNDVHGGIASAVNGMLSASSPHSFMGVNLSGKISVFRSRGNPYTQLVLRGGNEGSNFSKEAMSKSLSMIKQAGLFPSILVDCAHGNGLNTPGGQIPVLKSVIHDFIEGSEGLTGAQLESYLVEGNQNFTPGSNPSPHQSITDPCLSWEETVDIIEWASDKLQPAQKPYLFSSVLNS